MKVAFGGYQCEICNTIYKEIKDAAKCEETPVESPLLEIGDIVIDDQYDVENEMTVCGISFDGHEINYRMEWQSPDGNGEWEEVCSIYGNEMLEEFYDLSNKV